MTAFETHAGNKIDFDAVEAAMLGKYDTRRFLDVVTGRVENEPGVMRAEIPVLPKRWFEKEIRLNDTRI